MNYENCIFNNTNEQELITAIYNYNSSNVLLYEKYNSYYTVVFNYYNHVYFGKCDINIQNDENNYIFEAMSLIYIMNNINSIYDMYDISNNVREDLTKLIQEEMDKLNE